MLISRFCVAFHLLFLGIISVANASADKLDNLAACSGVVLESAGL